MPPRIPTEQDVHAMIETGLHESPRMIRRFTTGLAHYVYDVVTTSNRAVVVRIARPDAAAGLVGAIYWSNRLRPLGVPLPRILYTDVQAPFPFLLLERLPGTDIGNVYPQLAPHHKRAIVAEVVRAQALVGSLPRGSGFGYVGSYEAGFPYRTWTEVVLAALARSRARIIQAGVFRSTYVDRVQAQLARFEPYFAQVQPIAFLDDTTTKNVIVQDGRLSGIVDVDVVCFGDPMWTVGLTHMALLSRGYATDYVDMWCDLVTVTLEQRQALKCYTAIFCVDFMSELGQVFNQAAPLPIDQQRVQQLIQLAEMLLSGI